MDLKTLGVMLGGTGLVAGLGYLGTRSKQGRSYRRRNALSIGRESFSESEVSLDDRVLERLRQIAHARSTGADPAHDFLHVDRVASLANLLSKKEGARSHVAVAAALLHELVNLPKDHPESHRSGDLCAEEAERVLRSQGVSQKDTDAVVACIRDHAFSKGAKPSSLEVAVLQDADRLDAIGAIGIARCFATSAKMQTPFYEPSDPFARNRQVDDKKYAVDHFFRKLLKLEMGMNTETARQMAASRTEFMRTYLDRLGREIAPSRDDGVGTAVIP